jgi:hypothetical protein
MAAAAAAAASIRSASLDMEWMSFMSGENCVVAGGSHPTAHTQNIGNKYSNSCSSIARGRHGGHDGHDGHCDTEVCGDDGCDHATDVDADADDAADFERSPTPDDDDDASEIAEATETTDILNESFTTGEPSPLYISTKTMIAYLDTTVPIFDIFWKIPVIEYHMPAEGIVKKQIKITSHSPEELTEVDKKLVAEPRAVVQQITHVNHYQNGAANKRVFKDVKKVTVGLSTKDIISVRQKKRGVFYNCFVVNVRILLDGRFQEIHIKVFNTGKLEIPGIRSDAVLSYAIEKLCQVLSPLMEKPVSATPEGFRTVLINSNFHCGFGIDREKLNRILKQKYKLLSLYDPCSYPGVQCKFYFKPEFGCEFVNVSAHSMSQDGVCRCAKKCGKTGRMASEGTCIEVSFMIFRTGSILIVGRFGEDILTYVYNWIREVLIAEKPRMQLSYGDYDDAMSVMSGFTSQTGFSKPVSTKKGADMTDSRRRKRMITISEMV